MAIVQDEISLVKVSNGVDGINGIQGPKGEKGIPGEKGADGRTQYTHIAYSNSDDGIKDFSLGDSNRDYIGMYVDFNENDSTKPSDYSWSLIKGADGTQGTPGKPGADGKTPYFHTAWANSADGKTDFSTTVSTGKKYLGTYTDFIQADSNEPSKYSWSLIKGVDGKDTYIHKAWSWSSDGTDRFTDKYPNENILKKSTDFEFYQGYGGSQVTRSKIDATNIFGFKDATLFKIVGGTANLRMLMTTSGKFHEFLELDTNYTHSLYVKNIGTTELSVGFNGLMPGKYYKVMPGETKRIIHTGIRRLEYDWYQVIIDSQHRDELNFVLGHEKTEKSSEPTIYTPSPKDDFDNAWPKYEGYYSSHNPVQSTNPSDYTWSVIRGENGKDGVNGTNGKDGVTPKDVISGYLSNESIIVPATPTGAVTDLSKAFGDFVVFEGQTKKTNGVTYSKVSETGMTSSINSNGRYVVSALSADTGTATYRATYSGVTIDKIMIVVKNKQGPSGADGKDGQQGIQGVPGKDGSNGKDGATGPQGPPTGITTSATVPTNPYIGMLWQNTGTSNGYVYGVTYRWTGEKWDIYIFRAENIAANSLSAISANLGTITAGEILTSFFRGDSISSAIKKKGTTSISDGQFESSFDYVQVTNNTVLGKGDVTLDENGFMIRDLTTSNETMRSTSYKPEGIFMTDANADFGVVALKYQDLMTIDKTGIPASAGWSQYNTTPTANNFPSATRNGRVVQLAGAFTNNSLIEANAPTSVMGVLPIGFRPAAACNFVVQGTGINTYLMTVFPNGQITFDRYRGSLSGGAFGFKECGAGSWLNIACTFAAGDI